MDAETLLETRQGQYPAGRVPPDTVMLTGGVDVQKLCLYWTVRAWRVNMTNAILRRLPLVSTAFHRQLRSISARSASLMTASHSSQR